MSDDNSYDRVFISVEDGLKPAEDYAPSRKVRVELNYVLADEESYDDALGRLGGIASAQVDKLLGRTKITGDVSLTTQLAETSAKRTRRTAAQIAADKAAAGVVTTGGTDPTSLEDDTSPQSSDAPTDTTIAATPGVATSTDPTNLEDETLPQVSSTGSSVDTSDPFTIEPEPTTPPVDTSGQIAPISDGDLNSAIQVKNSELGSQAGTLKIRELIASYNSDPTKTFQVREIPADRRAEFINKLNAIA